MRRRIAQLEKKLSPLGQGAGLPGVLGEYIVGAAYSMGIEVDFNEVPIGHGNVTHEQLRKAIKGDYSEAIEVAKVAMRSGFPSLCLPNDLATMSDNELDAAIKKICTAGQATN